MPKFGLISGNSKKVKKDKKPKKSIEKKKKKKHLSIPSEINYNDSSDSSNTEEDNNEIINESKKFKNLV